jgi:UDP-N-acetylmuramate-alanine ligase
LYHPPVTLKLEFNYGSEYDQSEITLHLSDKDIEPILELIQSKLNPDVQKILKEAFEENDEELQNAIEARDPMECEHRINNNRLFNKLLGNEIS